MPILEKDKVKIYRTGDAVTATVINDTIDTAVDAHEKSVSAEAKSTNAVADALTAKSEAVAAKTNSQTALSKASDALANSETAVNISGNAESKAIEAYNTVRDLEERANRGEFKGEDGKDGDAAAVVQATGMYGFEVIDGHLMVVYSGDNAPDVSIVNGELILNV